MVGVFQLEPPDDSTAFVPLPKLQSASAPVYGGFGGVAGADEQPISYPNLAEEKFNMLGMRRRRGCICAITRRVLVSVVCLRKIDH